MPFQPTSYVGTLHHFTSRLTAFEHLSNSQASASPRHTILFIGGLGDGLGHPQYPSVIAQHLPQGWTIVEVLLSSAYTGWTTSSLQRDADELATALTYLRSLASGSAEQGAKIVVMGHSTGAQVCMEYLVGPWWTSPVPKATLERPRVDGIILQAGVSDAEGLIFSDDDMSKLVKEAQEWVNSGRGGDIMPIAATKGAFGASPSARRFLDLAVPKGMDDYFSSDLGDDVLRRTFGEVGRRGIPICMFLSEKDEHMPESVDKEALLDRWKQTVVDAGGKVGLQTCVIPDATHNLNKNDAATKEKLADCVSAFVRGLNEGRYERL